MAVELGVSEQVDVGGAKLKKFDVTMKLKAVDVMIPSPSAPKK
jgi:hypothetical protein